MKAIRIVDGQPTLVETAKPDGDGVRVKVASSSICGSDLHLIGLGWVEGQILGHEFAGYTPDGTAVAVEPMLGCNHCACCDEGRYALCLNGTSYLGIDRQGGMAEYVEVPEHLLCELPSGLPIEDACLTEPLAVAVNGLDRVGVQAADRVLIIGAGAIGLATAAVMHARGMTFDISARHPAQQAVAEALGGDTSPSDGYDVVIDAVGSSEGSRWSLRSARASGSPALAPARARSRASAASRAASNSSSC